MIYDKSRHKAERLSDFHWHISPNDYLRLDFNARFSLVNRWKHEMWTEDRIAELTAEEKQILEHREAAWCAYWNDMGLVQYEFIPGTRTFEDGVTPVLPGMCEYDIKKII